MSFPTIQTKRRRTKAFSDLIVISIICVIVLIVAMLFDLCEKLIDFLLEQRAWRLDELLVVVIVLAFAFSIYSFRRWLELRQEIVRRQETEKSLHLLSKQLVEAQEAERRFIAHELHDEIGQALTAIKINLQASKRQPGLALQEGRLDESIKIVEQTLQQVRNMSLDLRPAMLDDLGLGVALRWYVERVAQRTGFATQILIEPLKTRLPSHLETVCFRLTQEALTNIVRYAQARQVWVELRLQNDVLTLRIRDDGLGFDVKASLERAALGNSLGLLGMQERIHTVGGSLEIDSSPQSGSRITARFPQVSAFSATKS